MGENKKLKKFGSLLVASSLLAGVLAGCGSEDDEKPSDGGSTDSDKATEEVIKIGANLELSGPNASYGSGLSLGAKLAIEEINANGGIDGKKIELISYDNKSENAEAVNMAIKLITQDKVVAMLAPATSGNTVATVQLANDNKVPIVTGSGTAGNITVNDDGSVNKYAFRTCFIDPFQGTVAANFAINTLNAKNVAIFADNSSDYAKGLAAAFKETVEKAGGKVVKEVSYIAKDTDFRANLTNIKGANPDFVFIPGYYEEVGLIVKQAREMGITVPLMGADGWDSPTLVKLAGAEALNNTFQINHYSAEDPEPLIQDFVAAFKKANGDKAPDAFNVLGYDSIFFIVDAIQRAGSTDGEAIQKALAETKDLKLVTGNLSVDENHNPIKSATVLEYKDGKQVFNSKVNP